MAEGGRLRVVVLSCGDLGAEVAERLSSMPEVAAVTLVTAPYRRKPLGPWAKVRHVHRREGLGGLGRALLRKLIRRPDAGPGVGDAVARLSVPHHHFQDFHEPGCLEMLRRLQPDLGVVAGTYVLREEVFSIPRLGSINLHSGKAPEYRGAAPAFWELYNGESEVGVTIHWVTAALDAGRIIRQETFSLDPAPPGDPLEYVERYRREVLRPNGVRLLAEAVSLVAAGRGEGRPQDPARARTYRSPSYRDVRELRRRVRRRLARRGTG